MHRPIAALLLASTLSLLTPAVSRAASPQSDPLAFVKQAQGRIESVLAREAGSEGRLEALRAASRDLIDFDELARRAMAGHWDALTADQRSRFLATMNALVEAAWTGRAAGQGDYEVAYLGKEATGEGEAVVHTTLKTGSAAVPVDYRLHRTKGGWRAYDIVTDEVSLVESYRGQFNRILKTRGFDGLMETLERKRAELAAQGARD